MVPPAPHLMEGDRLFARLLPVPGELKSIGSAIGGRVRRISRQKLFFDSELALNPGGEGEEREEKRPQDE